MARPLSDDKRSAILEAATRVIVAQGLSAPTAGIAREAGVANGSLFTYFATKAELFDQLYLELKTEMAFVGMTGVPRDADLRTQFFHVWRNWASWAMAYPEKRRALAQLTVSDEITKETLEAGHKVMAPIGEILERCRALGPMRDVPKGFVVALLNSVAEATMETMVHDPKNAKKLCVVGFDALWRMLT